MIDEDEYDSFEHDGIIRVPICDAGRGISVECYAETATDNYRWLKKKSGERVLQRMWTIMHKTLDPVDVEWRDVEEVEEE